MIAVAAAADMQSPDASPPGLHQLLDPEILANRYLLALPVTFDARLAS
jgi:hypothetical protein